MKSAIPGAARVYALAKPRRSLREVFSKIYCRNDWVDPESVSGRGSTLARTEAVRRELPKLLARLGGSSLFDAACGDLNWLQHVELNGIDYIGADVVPELIENHNRNFASPGRKFLLLDVTKDPAPSADVILCRDLFIHFSFADIRKAIRNFKRSNARYLLATTHVNESQNIEIQTGEWRPLNLELPPLNFPRPDEFIVEDEKLGKHLALWQLRDL